jgi:signal transduction histidine kinase
MDAPFYQAIVASFPYGICVTDSEGAILHTNPTLERLLGWRLSEQRGQSLADCLERGITDPGQRLTWTVALSEALSHGKATNLGSVAEFIVESEDSHAVDVFGVVLPWQDGSKGRGGALLVFHDSTLQKDLKASQRKFLSVLSHELGSPLANLAAAIDLLSSRLDADDTELLRLCRIIHAEMERFGRLLGQSLSPPRGGEGASLAEESLVVLAPILSRVVDMFQIRGSGHHFVVQVPEDLPFLWSDADRIQQVLSNLLDNAVQYSPPGDQITVTAEEFPDKVLIRVSDRGSGVPPEDRDHLFEPLFRGEHKRAPAEGQGLGLSIAKSLAQQLGGDLWYDKRAEEGACFCFTLPRV